MHAAKESCFKEKLSPVEHSRLYSKICAAVLINIYSINHLLAEMGAHDNERNNIYFIKIQVVMNR